MAYAQARSANAELHEGMTDGKHRKVINDRGGVVDPLTHASRANLTDGYYGIHEAPVKMLPDGRSCRTPYTVSTPQATPEYF